MSAVSKDLVESYNISIDGVVAENIGSLKSVFGSISAVADDISLNILLKQHGIFRDYVQISSHQNLPDWWGRCNNRLFVPSSIGVPKIPHISVHPGKDAPRNSLLFLNGVCSVSIMLWGNDNVLYVDRHTSLPSANFSIGGAFVFVGSKVRSTSRLNVNCRNGASVVLEKDVLLASNVVIMSDDCHTVIDKNTRQRINPFGGSILVKRHVWIADGATIMGNSVVAENNIVGANAFVRNIVTPIDSVIAGVPARCVKSNVTWDERDLSPDSPLLMG